MRLSRPKRVNAVFQQWIDRSISNRISVATLSVTVLVLFLLIGATYGFLHIQLDRQAKITLSGHASSLAARLAGILEQGLQAGLVLAGSPLITGLLADDELSGAVLTRLQDTSLFSEKNTIISIHDYRGRPIVVHGAQFTPKGHVVYSKSVPEAGNSPVARLFRDGQQMRLLFAYPLYYRSTATREGALIISVDLDSLIQGSVNDLEEGLRITLTGSNGERLAGFSDSGSHWVRQSVALGPKLNMPDLDISVVAAIEESKIHEPLNRFNLAYLLLALLSLSIAVILARMVGRRMTEPLAQLSSLMANMKDMGATLQLQLPARNDEIGQVIETFNRMLSELHLSDLQLKQMLRERTERLEFTERSLSLVSEESVTFTWTWRPLDGAVLAVSSAIEPLLGYAPDLFLKNAAFREQLLNDEDRALIDAAVGSLQPGKPLSIRYRLHDAQGRWRWFNDRLAGLYDGEDRLEAVEGICTDVTALKEAEILAAQRAKLVDQIYRMSPDGFLVTDLHRRASFANPALLRMIGLDSSEVSGRSIEELDALIEKNIAKGAIYTPMTKGFNARPVMLRLERPRSMVLLRSFLGDAESDNGSVFFFRDVSGEAAVERAKSDFLRTAAHELRTPLTSVLGFSEILLNRDIDEGTRKDLLETIHQTAQRLSAMAGDLLDIARLDTSPLGELNLEQISLPPFLQAAVNAIVAPDGRQAVLEPVPVELQAYTDRERLEVVLRQILSNAFKFSKADKAVNLIAEAGEIDGVRGILLKVQDCGVGMTPEVVDRIFERFYRADLTGETLGTGLGMSIVRETVGLLHGKVKVSSVPGEGTEVTVWLPENQLDYIVG